jgi:predicted RND superfamily exporter protein
MAFALAAALAASAAGRVHIDNSVEKLMMAGDPIRDLDAVAKDEFGNDEILLIGFELEEAYDADDLRKLAAITESVASLDGVRRVRSLAETEDVRGSDGALDASALVDFDTLDRDFESIRSRVSGHRLYDQLLVSNDSRTLGMLVYADNENSNNQALHALTAAVTDLVERKADPWKVYQAGYPVTALEANRIVKRDLALLTPVALIGVAVVLYLFTGRLFPIVLLLVQIGWVELAGHGWLGLSGAPLNVVVSALPTMLMATSAAYVIYAVGLLARVPADEDPGPALVAMLYRPVLLSGLSTGIGFWSLRLIGVEAIGDLGNAMAVGIAAAVAGTLLLLPALIQRWNLRVAERHVVMLESMSMVGVHMAAHPWRVIAATAGLLLVMIPGLSRLTVHTDTLNYFADDNRVRAGAEFFKTELTSGFLLNVVLRGNEPGRAIDPDVLTFADQLSEEIKTDAHVHRTISMLDYFYLMDAALRPDAEPRPTPGSRAAAAQYMLLYEAGGDPEDYDRYINFDRSALSMIVSISGGSRVYLDAAEHIERFAAAAAPADLQVDTLGTTFLYSRAMDGLTRGMLRGLAVASVLIGVVMLAGLRSLRLAAVAAVPNLTPILLCGGALGYLDVPLSMGTSLVGCVALGLAVDDTAHVLGHIEEEASLESVYRLVGPALILTTVALGIGFSAMMLSEFQSVVAFGAAVAGTLTIALVADVVLLPSLLALAGYAVTERTTRDERGKAPRPTSGQARKRAA